MPPSPGACCHARSLQPGKHPRTLTRNEVPACPHRWGVLPCKFPGVEESRSYGTPSLKVKRRFLRSEAEGGLAIHCDMMEREMLMQAAPETFYITDHYASYPMVLINLDTARWEALPDIIERAWRMVATPKLVKEFEERSG